jgi:imidazole glycerol-phosphate synthase subunit HisF
MAYKRLIAVVTVKEGRVVKSYGYRFWRPAGRLVSVLRNLDRWLVDEIVVLDISGRDRVDLGVMESIREAQVSTPVSYGGGVRSLNDIDVVLGAGCDRIVVESLARGIDSILEIVVDRVGAQAVIASLPLVRTSTELGIWCGGVTEVERRHVTRLARDLAEWIDGLPVTEVLAIDVDAEGSRGRFALLDEEGGHPLITADKGIIWFGGISASQLPQLFALDSTVGVAIGHLNLERELAVLSMRDEILSAGGGWVRRTGT